MSYTISKQLYKKLKADLIKKMIESCQIFDGYYSKILSPTKEAETIRDIILQLEEIFEPNIYQNGAYKMYYIQDKAKEYHYI